MPPQDLSVHVAKETRHVPIHPEPRLAPALRRTFVFGGAALISAIAINEMRLVLNLGGLTILEIVVLALFALNTIWISFSVPMAIAGFVRLLFRRSRTAEAAPLTSRTALLMPLYNEEPARAAAALDAMASDLAARGVAAHFDLFILSDTTDGDIALAEAGGRLGAAPPSERRPVDLLSPARAQHCPQVRQHPGVLRTLGPRLRSLPGPGRGQSDGGCDHHRARTPHGERSRRRLDPDRSAPAWRDDPGGAPATIRRKGLRTGAGVGPGVVDGARGKLLGTQRRHPNPRLHGVVRAAGAARAPSARRSHPEPRLRRGRSAPSRRLERPDRRRPAGLLRSLPSHPRRPGHPRPSVVPGKPATRPRAAARKACTG